MSTVDIDAGRRWNIEIASELEAADFGILLVTKDNLNSPWLNFEAGALAKSVGLTQVCPIAVDIPVASIVDPLAQFQAVTFDEVGILQLTRSLYRANPAIITERQQETIFHRMWPEFEDELSHALAELHRGHLTKPRFTPRPRISIVVPANGKEAESIHHAPVPEQVQELLDLVYGQILGEFVPPYSYGELWHLRNTRTRERLTKAGEHDTRSLAAAGVEPDDRLMVEFVPRA